MGSRETRSRGEVPTVVERRPGTAGPGHRSERTRSSRCLAQRPALSKSAGLATPDSLFVYGVCPPFQTGERRGGTGAPRARRPVGTMAGTNAHVRSRPGSHLRAAIVRSPTVPPFVYGTAASDQRQIICVYLRDLRFSCVCGRPSCLCVFVFVTWMARKGGNYSAVSWMAPPQEEPAPAVQPKQWRPVTICRPSKRAGSRSAIRVEFLSPARFSRSSI